MVGVVRDVFVVSCYQWMVALAVSCISIFCCIPQQAFGHGKETDDSVRSILAQVDNGNPDLLIDEFDSLEDFFTQVDNPLNEGRKFFQAYINQINTRFGLNLTIPDACHLVRTNLEVLQIPLEAQNALLAIIELLEGNSRPTQIQKDRLEQLKKMPALYWPWEWKWFRLNKKMHRHNRQYSLSKENSPLMDTELPANCYLGGCELLAGALAFLVPIPGAAWLGGIMIGDGVRRVFDGIVQLSDERRADPNYVPPKPPF